MPRVRRGWKKRATGSPPCSGYALSRRTPSTWSTSGWPKSPVTTVTSKPVRASPCASSESCTSMPPANGTRPPPRHDAEPAHGGTGEHVVVARQVAQAEIGIVRLALHAQPDHVVPRGDVRGHRQRERVAHDLGRAPVVHAVIAAERQVIGAEPVTLVPRALD